MSRNAQLVIDRIERAFASVRLGDGVSLGEAEVMDDYGSDADRLKARACDELDDWMRIPDEVIGRCEVGLSYFDAEGMRFHLPAYMRFTLRHYKESASAIIDYTIYTLGRGGEEFTLLNGAQRAAVRLFLKFIAFNAGRDVAWDDAKRALDEIWSIRPAPPHGGDAP